MPRRKNSGIHIRHNISSEIATTSGSNLFDAVFDALVARDRAAEAFKNAITREARAHYARKYCDARRDLYSSRAWHPEIVLLTTQYLSGHDAVGNIAELVEWLKQQGVPIHKDDEAGPGLTHRAVRMILRSAFNITGAQGRKPRK